MMPTTPTNPRTPMATMPIRPSFRSYKPLYGFQSPAQVASVKVYLYPRAKTPNGPHGRCTLPRTPSIYLYVTWT